MRGGSSLGLGLGFLVVLKCFVLSFDNISWIVFFQAMNLGSVKLTHNVRVLYTYPKTTLISSNAPSEFAFYGSVISSLSTGSF